MSNNFAASRKQVFVDRKFQTRFILNYVLLLIIGTAVFSTSAYLILNHQIENSFFSAHLAISRTGDLLSPTLIYLSLAFVVILGAATAGVTLLISHKICGPLLAIVRYLKMMAEGQLNFVAKLRTDDQTAAVADTLTETIRTMGGRVVMAKEAVDSLKKDLSDLNAFVAHRAAGQGDLIKAVHDLNEHARIIEERLAFFRTE